MSLEQATLLTEKIQTVLAEALKFLQTSSLQIWR